MLPSNNNHTTKRLPRLEHNENVKCVGSPTREFRLHDFFTIPLHMNECTIFDVSELAMCHQVHLRASMSFEFGLCSAYPFDHLPRKIWSKSRDRFDPIVLLRQLDATRLKLRLFEMGAVNIGWKPLPHASTTKGELEWQANRQHEKEKWQPEHDDCTKCAEENEHDHEYEWSSNRPSRDGSPPLGATASRKLTRL
jgi:hypothetical protein